MCWIFYCPAARLAIEVDGEMHGIDTNIQHDRLRDAWLMTQNIGTLRILARDVLEDLEAVVWLIVGECRTRSAPEN